MELKNEELSFIDLRSDTLTKPSPEMREAMASAEVGDDVFGEDPSINHLQEMSAEMFGMEAGLFVPSGTMTNEISIHVHTRPGDEVILDALSHIINFESGAPGLLSGVNLITLPNKNGHITADNVERAIRPEGIQFAKTALICLENTSNYAGGAVFPLSEIEKISTLARKKGIRLHLDGARIFNAVVASGNHPDQYARYFDSVTFCISKGLGAPVGSVLMGSRAFIDEARKVRKIFGGGMRQAGILAAAGIYALKHNVNRLKDDHNNAQMLTRALGSTHLFEILPEEVATNIVIFRIKDRSVTPAEAARKLAQYGILVFPFGENQLRAVTHLDISEEDIKEACSRLIKHF
ncbi:threonine aldolase family protein [candidate division KSB1 bacterium]